MAIRPVFRMVQYRVNDQLYHAPQFIPWSICELHLLFLWFLSLGQYHVDQLFFLFQNRNYKLHIESEYIV